MAARDDPSNSLPQAYWLASRGTRQMDLALRFTASAKSQGLSVLALKGISIADELYGGVENRPMADVDLLVVDTSRFEAAGQVAVAMGLVETEASDHALVFKEPSSGVVLELHISLTSCPGLFKVDPRALWERRKPCARSSLLRLADPDLVVHLALHTAFQHGFAANEYHYRDFVLALDRLGPTAEQIATRAAEWGATEAVGAMAEACYRRSSDGQGLPSQIEALRAACPPSLARWIKSRAEFPPTPNLADLTSVRYRLAPSVFGYLVRTLFPKGIPGRTLPRPGTFQRLSNLARTGIADRVRRGSTPA